RRGAGPGRSSRHRGHAGRSGGTRGHQEGQEGRSAGRREVDRRLTIDDRRLTDDGRLKAIVGLGNPGPKYRGTRHNVGFAVLNELSVRRRVVFDSSPVEALVAKVNGESPMLLVKPMTFMNLSGEAVGGLLRYYKIDAGDLLVIVDEAQLPLGK